MVPIGGESRSVRRELPIFGRKIVVNYDWKQMHLSWAWLKLTTKVYLRYVIFYQKIIVNTCLTKIRTQQRDVVKLFNVQRRGCVFVHPEQPSERTILARV